MNNKLYKAFLRDNIRHRILPKAWIPRNVSRRTKNKRTSSA